MGKGENPPHTHTSVQGASKVLVRRVTATSGDPKSETLAKGIGIPDTARGKAALNPALTRNLIKGKTTRATPRQSKAPSSHLEGGKSSSSRKRKDKGADKDHPISPRKCDPPKGWKKE